MHDPHITLKRLLSITPDWYEVFYAPLYPHLKNWIKKNVADLSSDVKATRVQTIWRYGVDALKIRCGYLLPFGSDAETCYREQEVWSYAVFTAALLDSFMTHFNLSVTDAIEIILPTQGLAWLKAYTSVFNDWHHYLQEKDKKTAFYTLEKQLERSRRRSFTTDDTKNAESVDKPA